MMYWQKEIETMDRKDLVKFQLERLKQTIELAGNSPFYHKIFKEKGITPDSFQSLEDLQKLPFTTKDDLRNNYPFGLAAIPLQKREYSATMKKKTSLPLCGIKTTIR